MNKDLEKKLEEKFSFMKKGKSLAEQHKEGFIGDLYSAFGLECDDGWYDLIYDLCTEITKFYDEIKKPINLHVNQIKEKFGGLRFYFSLDNEKSDTSDAKNDNHELYKKIHQIVQKYCDKSYEVCEVCGKPGKLREDLPWIRTLCEGCYKEEKKQ